MDQAWNAHPQTACADLIWDGCPRSRKGSQNVEKYCESELTSKPQNGVLQQLSASIEVAHRHQVEALSMDCYKRQAASALKLSMKLVSIPANPVPDNFVTGELKTPDGVTLRFARWQPPAGRKGTVCILQGRGEWIEKYFETVRDLRARGFAVADARLARPGPVGAHARRPPQRLCARLRRIRQRSRDLHARDRAAGLSAAAVRARPFDGRHRAHSRRLSRPPLVRSHGADRAADRARTASPATTHGASAGARAAHRRLRQHVRAAGRQSASWRQSPSSAIS